MHARRRSALAAPAVAAAALAATSARADGAFDVRGAHLAYGIGGAWATDRPGFRQGVDAGVAAGVFRTTRRSTIGLWDTRSGLLVGASGLYGFERYPSFASFEVGGGSDGGVAAGGATAGPAVRFGSDDFRKGFGIGARAMTDVLLVQAGLRVIAIFSEPRETQITFTIGVGRF